MTQQSMQDTFAQHTSQLLDFNQKIAAWQLEQLKNTQQQLRERTESVTQMTMDALEVSVNSVLQAQRTMLRAMAPQHTDAN